jgi:peptidyl-prolyl cis-trans isomerase C
MLRRTFHWPFHLLREPLVHFVAAGFATFLIYGVVNRGSHTPDSQRIEIAADDIRRIEISWQARWQRPPTADELRNLIEEQVKEEILYREALAMGLERNDEIIRRRLAQKMDFLAEDIAALREPAPGELEAWYARNGERFAPPPLVTFHHLFFAFDQRGARAEADARMALATLKHTNAGQGDVFMFQDAYAEQTPDQVVRVFGSKFAGSLFKEQPDAWRGPIESGYGWHLVWIDALTPSEPPAFQAVAKQVETDWLSEQRTQAKQATFAAARARYQVVIAETPRASATVADTGNP